MRPILPQELKATSLVSMVIEEASAKIRNDGPLDLEADYAAPCWAGVIPIATRLGALVPDARVTPQGAAEPEVGHFAEGAALDEILIDLARRSAAG